MAGIEQPTGRLFGDTCVLRFENVLGVYYGLKRLTEATQIDHVSRWKHVEAANFAVFWRAKVIFESFRPSQFSPPGIPTPIRGPALCRRAALD
jgi:hypothetical protein